jgi:small subunit ribosomal protein S26e
MGKKRRSRGRNKPQGRGSSGTVQCSGCGRMVPEDKAKRVTARVTLVDPILAKELRAQGATLPSSSVTKYFCVSCAVHRKVVKIRPKGERKFARPAFR